MDIAKTVSRLGTVENLPGGSTHDLLLISIPEGFPEGQILFKLETTPRKITGIQKVAQVFMKILFTQKGSDVINYRLGTDFPELAIGANRTSEDSLFISQVVEAVKDAEAQTRDVLTSNKQDLASQLRDVSIIGMNTDTESLSMYIRLTTKAGETASVSIPFPQLDMKLSAGT
jgi:phage baseplate assembly protein W